MAVTDVVRARSALDAKERAAAALADMGMSLSDALRLLALGVAGEQVLPSEAAVASAISRKAEAESRQARAFARIEDFMADLRPEGD